MLKLVQHDRLFGLLYRSEQREEGEFRTTYSGGKKEQTSSRCFFGSL